MNAATEARDIIAQATRDGLEIRKGDAPDKIKLRGAADAVARWKPIIAQHKADILQLVEAANDEGRPLPGVIVPAADPSDPTQFGIECLSYLHAHGLVLALEFGHIVMHGTASPQIIEEARTLIELHGDDLLLAALKAQEAAQRAIQRAARPCWQCRHLRTTSSAASQLPRCDAGHALVYRSSATRTWPGRVDARNCGDRTT
jgi:hypothetical protein